jgi:hypothetical protein
VMVIQDWVQPLSTDQAPQPMSASDAHASHLPRQMSRLERDTSTQLDTQAHNVRHHTRNAMAETRPGRPGRV